MEMTLNTRQSNADLAAGAAAVHAMARRLAFESPSLSDLTAEQLERVAQAVIVGNLTGDMKRRADLERIDYRAEVETFLTNASRTKSPHTRAAYGRALARLEAWASKRGVNVLEMKPMDADDFAYALQTEGRAAGSVRLDISGASSFFTFLSRRFDQVQNPFRGTKARPECRAAREVAFPTAREVKAILAATTAPADKAAVSIMAFRGLRVGALPSLTIKAERFAARSKGKSISGELPKEALAALDAAGVDTKKPFAADNARALAARFAYTTKKLAAAGKIEAAFSVHDLRHFFAVEQYRKNKDIYALKELLGHASIQVTEIYLKGMNLL